jgi:hypothetical protein
MRPRNRFPWSQWDRGIGSRSLNETEGSDMKIFVKIQRSQWDRGIGFCGLNETEGSVPTVSMRLRKCRYPYINEYWFSFPLKGNHRKNQYICKHCGYLLLLENINIKGEHWQKNSVSAVSLRPRNPILAISESIPNRNHMRNSCRPWIRAPGGIVWWKKPRVENLVTLSL